MCEAAIVQAGGAAIICSKGDFFSRSPEYADLHLRSVKFTDARRVVVQSRGVVCRGGKRVAARHRLRILVHNAYADAKAALWKADRDGDQWRDQARGVRVGVEENRSAFVNFATAYSRIESI